jgi:hypothetical protein
MVSTFYSSNEQKQKDYLTQRRLQEDNDFNQQEIVDAELEKELGLEQRATKTALMSKRVADKLASLNKKSTDANELVNAINAGTVDQLFKKIQLLEDSSLNKNQQSIRDNLKIKENKNVLNEIIQDSLPLGAVGISEAIIEALGGSDNRSNVIDLINKASKINVKDYTSVRQPTNKKREARETEKMASEDINYALKPLPSTPATQEDIDKLNEAQAKLDLISLFQQDVKEGRKRQALKDLEQLNADEDLRLRINFKKALDDMMDEVNNRSASAKLKKQYKEDKAILDKMMQLIENQRMHDSFMEYSNLAIKDEFRKKIARNLKSALNYKKNINLINNYLKNNSKDYTSDSTEATEADSTMGDASFKGRPVNPNLAKERLARFQRLENKPNKTAKEKKQFDNLRAQLFRKPMALEDKPENRPTTGRPRK